MTWWLLLAFLLGGAAATFGLWIWLVLTWTRP